MKIVYDLWFALWYYGARAAMWAKYGLIRAKAAATGRTVVNFSGGSYSVYGNVVQRIGDCR